MTATPFGTMPDGTKVEAVTIAAGDLSVRIITLGAIIQDVRFAGVPHPLVLGFPTLAGYLNNPNYFGAVAGRYANRIAGGRFSIDGESFQLSQNEGANHLHGGTDGYGARVWSILDIDEASVTLGLDDPDGTSGYPGRVKTELTYSVEEPGTLRTSIRSTTDAPTLVNLAQHSYFNLAGEGTIRDHLLTIPAETYLPTDAAKIPTGERRPVAGTAYDFRAERPIGGDPAAVVDIYDHNFNVTEGRTAIPHLLARLVSPKSGVVLEVHSTEPGVQFYGGHMIACRDAGLTGEMHGANAGLCLEPQVYPDSPNQPGFPSAVLRPGEIYRQETLFVFSRA